MEHEIKIGDKVKIKYAGPQFWAVGLIGTVIENDYPKYDYRVRLDYLGYPSLLYFYIEDLERL